jgi:lysozyme
VLQLIRLPELAQCRFDALVSFTFNFGAGNLQASRLRRAVNRGEHERAPGELARWVYGGGRRLAGLVRRRKAEAVLYRSS